MSRSPPRATLSTVGGLCALSMTTWGNLGGYVGISHALFVAKCFLDVAWTRDEPLDLLALAHDLGIAAAIPSTAPRKLAMRCIAEQIGALATRGFADGTGVDAAAVSRCIMDHALGVASPAASSSRSASTGA